MKGEMLELVNGSMFELHIMNEKFKYFVNCASKDCLCKKAISPFKVGQKTY